MKKITALFAALCLFVSLMPISTFATEADAPPTGDAPTTTLQEISSFTEPAVIEIANGDTRTEEEIISTFPAFLIATVDGVENTQLPVSGWARVNPTAEIAYSTSAAAEFYYEPTIDSSIYSIANTAIMPNQMVRVGNVVHSPQLAAGTGAESFSFQVTVENDGDPLTTDDLSFSIPLSGASGSNPYAASYGKPYNWSIEWDTENTADTPEVWYNGVAAPSGSPNLGNANAADSAGISHTYPAGGTYTITITNNAVDPVNPTIANNDAWLAAFGFSGATNMNGANINTNKAKVTAIISGFTPLMTRTQAQVASDTPQIHYEWAYVFYGCTNLTEIGPGFSSGWESIKAIGDNFAIVMFENCTSLVSMNDSFTLPQSAALTSIGSSFAGSMFCNCENLQSMGANFNLPQSAALSSIGDYFAFSMFEDCTALQSMSANFNLPQSAALTSIGGYFGGKIFAYAGTDLVINEVFCFPKVTQEQVDNAAFSNLFDSAGLALNQTRSAQSIMNGNPTPTRSFMRYNTFNGQDAAFFDWPILPEEWGGRGAAPDHTVTFQSGQGVTPTYMLASQNAINGRPIGKPATPTAEGYTFINWYTDPALTNFYDFTQNVTGDLTLYASWMSTNTGTSTGGATNPAVSPDTGSCRM